jgi:cysteine dioxygenase
MAAYDATRLEYKRYALFDAGKKYTRNLIATDHKTFALMLLCWNKGAESPIHDHPCTGCFARTVEGTVRETRYRVDCDNNKLTAVSTADCPAGAVVFIDDSMGPHKVGNPSLEAEAVTLHLYAPPFSVCSIWLNAGNARAVARPSLVFHSAGGVVTTPAPPPPATPHPQQQQQQQQQQEQQQQQQQLERA